MPSASINVLYIPRVNRTHMGHGEYVKRVFEHQGIAVLKSVEFVEHDIPNAAFGFAIIKVQFWIPGIISKHFQERLQDSSKETRVVFSDPSYWIVLPYSEKQKTIKIPPPPLRSTSSSSSSSSSLSTEVRNQPNQHQPNSCICGCGGVESDCSSQILYNQFTDDIWAPLKNGFWISTESTTAERENECKRVSYILGERQRLGSCRNIWSSSMTSMEDNFRFYDVPIGFDASSY